MLKRVSSGGQASYNETGIRPLDDNVNYITFNQDNLCIALGLNNGYKIFNCNPNFGKSYQWKQGELIGIIEMLYTTSLLAIVGLGEEPGSSPRKLKIINTKRNSTICDLLFPKTILQVKLTFKRLIVLLEEQIYIYDINTMKLLHTIETSPNVNGLCTVASISNDDIYGNDYLAYPSPPKTITHDSLLAQGINTNGGSNSVQNNIQSVSNAPNRVGDVIIFNLKTLQPLSVIEAHKATLAAITLSDDGTLLATASDKGTIVRVFEVETGVKLYQFRRGTYPTKIYSLNFSKDKNYVVSTSSSGTVHIFRLGEEEALENKHKKKKLDIKKPKLNNYETIDEESIKEDLQGTPTTSLSNITATNKPLDHEDFLDEIQDDGDDSDADDLDDDGEDFESIDMLHNKQRKLSGTSTNSFTSIGTDEIPNSSQVKTEPIVDQNRLSVARLIRRSSQKIGRKAAQKLGEFLPQRFSSILEPTRHFASLKINSNSKDVKAIAILINELKQDLVPQSYLLNESPENSQVSKEMTTLNLLHIHVVTSEGILYVYGLDPERGGDCILLNQYALLGEQPI